MLEPAQPLDITNIIEELLTVDMIKHVKRDVTAGKNSTLENFDWLIWNPKFRLIELPSCTWVVVLTKLLQFSIFT